AQRDAEGNAVLRHHQVGGSIDRMVGDELFNTADTYFPNIFWAKVELLAQLLQRFNRRMGIDVASAALDADIHAFEVASQAIGERTEVRRIRIGLAKTEFSFEHTLRPGESFARQQGGGHAALGGFAEMQSLDHSAFPTAGKFDQS